MSKLNGDILYHIFQDLNDLNKSKRYRKSLFPCLLVNKLWCEIMIPILWSYPYKYVNKKELLFNIIISHLSDNSIKLLKDKNIIKSNFQKQNLLFNYIRFCKYYNNIHEIFPNKIILKEEIYKLFISECSSYIKSLSMDMLNYPIYQYPGANISLSNLYELNCNIKDQKFYHELAQICRSIEKIYNDIYELDINVLAGLAELIENQNQIKYIYINEDCECKRIAQALEKHANSIPFLNVIVHTTFLYFFFQN
jgi:hypothetical protein